MGTGAGVGGGGGGGGNDPPFICKACADVAGGGMKAGGAAGLGGPSLNTAMADPGVGTDGGGGGGGGGTLVLAAM